MRHGSAFLFGPAAMAALALAAAGCGGGGKTSSTTTVTKAPATTKAAATTTAAAAGATQAKTTTAAAADLSGLASSANCRQLADLGSKFSSAMSGAANSSDLKKQAQLLKEFADRTPSEIRPDFQVLADYFGKVADAVGKLKPGAVPDAAALAKLQQLSTSIDSNRLQQASEHITTWLQNNCSA